MAPVDFTGLLLCSAGGVLLYSILASPEEGTVKTFHISAILIKYCHVVFQF